MTKSTKTKLDLKKVCAILNDKKISYGEISKFTGMSKGAFRPYRTGERSVDKMQIRNALKFEEMYDKYKKHTQNP